MTFLNRSTSSSAGNCISADTQRWSTDNKTRIPNLSHSERRVCVRPNISCKVILDPLALVHASTNPKHIVAFINLGRPDWESLLARRFSPLPTQGVSLSNLLWKGWRSCSKALKSNPHKVIRASSCLALNRCVNDEAKGDNSDRRRILPLRFRLSCVVSNDSIWQRSILIHEH